MAPTNSIDPKDTPELRKERGAFFTPSDITDFVANWAIRAAGDRVMEPSAGDAAFLVAAVARLAKLHRGKGAEPEVDGVEIHEHSARAARRRVREAGGKARVRHSDFFDIAPEPVYDAVIGNPPFIRYQNFSGEARAKSRQAALKSPPTTNRPHFACRPSSPQATEESTAPRCGPCSRTASARARRLPAWRARGSAQITQ